MTFTIPTLAWFGPLLIAVCIGWVWLTWTFIFGPLDRWMQRRIQARIDQRIREIRGQSR